MKRLSTGLFRRLSALLLVPIVITTARADEWKAHAIRQLNGKVEDVRIPAPDRDRELESRRGGAVYRLHARERPSAHVGGLRLSASCRGSVQRRSRRDVEFAETRDPGDRWQSRGRSRDGAVLLGGGQVLLYADSRRFSRDYGQTWTESVPLEPTPDGKPWAIWDPPLVDRDAQTGKILRLVETGYAWFLPPEVTTAHQQAYLRCSTDEGRTWSRAAKVPQWEAVSEVAVMRAANGHMVAACRTDIPDEHGGRDARPLRRTGNLHFRR